MSGTDWNAMNPVALWRDWVVKSEAQWSEALSKVLQDERTSGALNRQVDELRMMHRLFSEMTQASLAAANLPARTDFEALDERLGRLEDGIAKVSAELALLRGALVTNGAATPTRPKPSRNRKPPANAAVEE